MWYPKMEEEPKDDGKCWYLPYFSIPNLGRDPKRKFIFQPSHFQE